jgi:hypothetical protein
LASSGRPNPAWASVCFHLPGHYLHWFARTGFPPGEIGRLLALMQALITTAFSRCLILYESAKHLIVAASPRHTLHLSIDR